MTSFSVCIPGNCSAALLNNETSAYMYVCVGWWEDKGNSKRFRAGMKVQIYLESVTEKDFLFVLFFKVVFLWIVV